MASPSNEMTFLSEQLDEELASLHPIQYQEAEPGVEQSFDNHLVDITSHQSTQPGSHTTGNASDQDIQYDSWPADIALSQSIQHDLSQSIQSGSHTTGNTSDQDIQYVSWPADIASNQSIQHASNQSTQHASNQSIQHASHPVGIASHQNIQPGSHATRHAFHQSLLPGSQPVTFYPNTQHRSQPATLEYNIQHGPQPADTTFPQNTQPGFRRGLALPLNAQPGSQPADTTFPHNTQHGYQPADATFPHNTQSGFRRGLALPQNAQPGSRRGLALPQNTQPGSRRGLQNTLPGSSPASLAANHPRLHNAYRAPRANQPGSHDRGTFNIINQPGYAPVGVGNSNHNNQNQPGYATVGVGNNSHNNQNQPRSHQTPVAAGVGNSDQIHPSFYPSPPPTSVTLPGGQIVTVTKGTSLVDAMGAAPIVSSAAGTLLIINLKVKPSMLPQTHPDSGNKELAPRMATVYVEYMSTERISAIVNAKANSVRGRNPQQPRRLCFKCLEFDPVSRVPTETKLDLTQWNRSNPMRHILDWHPLRMVMQAAIPVEITWHKDCLRESGKPLAKVREEWINSTPGALWRELDAADAAALMADPGTTPVTLFSVLPPPDDEEDDDGLFVPE
ncbi:hypothetical protein DV735_g2951, partial [Chaetothyriales sp. CBS 134920]